MIILDTTTRKLQIKLAGAVTTNELQWTTSYVDITATTFTAGSNNGVTAGATPTDCVASPATSTQRQVKFITVQNADTVTATVTIIYNDNGTARTLWKGTLAVGDNLQYADGEGFRITDSTGATKTSGSTGAGDVVGPASATDGNIALFDGTTGKLIKNSSYSPTSFATSAQGATADTAIQPTDTVNALTAPAADFSMNSNKITNVTPGVASTDVATVGQIVSGTTFINPVATPNVIDDSLSTPPGSPVAGEAYLVGATATGAWTGLEGHLMQYPSSGSTWIDILDRAVIIGDRLGLALEHGTVAGGFATKDDNIAQITTATPGSYAYTFTAPSTGYLTSINGTNSPDFGHQYGYSGSAWVETNPGSQSIAIQTHLATSKTTPVDADELPLVDSAASNILKKLTWANLKATLKTYFDTLYPSGSGTSTGANTGDETATTLGALIGGAGDATPNNTDFVATSLTAGGILKRITWTNVKAFLKTYFDTLYPSGSGTSTGTNTGDQTISDATISTTDITTNDVSTSKHGFFPKLPASTGKFLKDDLTWATIAGSGDMLGSNNLSDVASAVTSRNNILPSKTGNTGKVLAVNAGETDYELITPSGGGGVSLGIVYATAMGYTY